MTGFHEVRFPLDISLQSRGGPQRRTDVVQLGSGREERNARWAHSRRRYDAGYGIKSLVALSAVLAFFEERRGMLYGFRWRDRADARSCAPDAAITPFDQSLGLGDGATTTFQLAKTYGGGFAPYRRIIHKPVADSLRIAIDGRECAAGAVWTLDPTCGLVTFGPGHAPPAGKTVTAGFAFDVPVRFDTDYLEVDHAGFDAGEIPHIPIIEIIP
jgi:uncharacterized protein (TIGR02217 family)